MRQFGGNKIDGDLLKPLWLRRLPDRIQPILACVSGSLEALAVAGDKVHEVHARPTIAAVQQPELGELKREMVAQRSGTGREFARDLLFEKGDRVAGLASH